MQTFNVRVRNSVQIQPTGNEGLALVLDATSWRDDALLVQVILGGFLFQLHKSTDVFGDSGKFVIIN
jgi:hypothetical protein